MTQHNICLSGSGGQGLILGGALLAHAAVRDGKNVTMTSSYGPEARGGASRSNLIISDTPIDYPIPEKMDIILAMNQESCNKFVPELKDDGILILDSTLVMHHPPIKHYSIPFTKLATKVGVVVTANVIALGSIIALTDIVKPVSLKEALKERLRADLRPINEKALNIGLREGKKLKKNIDEYYTY